MGTFADNPIADYQQAVRALDVAKGRLGAFRTGADVAAYYLAAAAVYQSYDRVPEIHKAGLRPPFEMAYPLDPRLRCDV